MLQIDTKYLTKDAILYKRGFFWYKDYGKLYTNVTRYDLHSLYASLAVALKDHFKSDRSQELSIVESFLENRQFLKTKDPVNYQRLKTITNSFYGDLFSQDKALITHYVHEFYQDFIEQYKLKYELFTDIYYDIKISNISKYRYVIKNKFFYELFLDITSVDNNYKI